MWKKLLRFVGPSTVNIDPSTYDRIDPEKLPRHVAIIMDGNGRWAKSLGQIRTSGHTAGVKRLKEILQVAIDLELEALTVYAFSTENWKRPHTEVDFLMNLFSEYLRKELDEMNRKQVRFHPIGKEDGLPPALLAQMKEAEKMMAGNTGVHFNVAVNYGGQDELLRATQKIAQEVQGGKLKPEEIDTALFERHLDTAGDAPVDLLIRTSGDLRLSNFLLWQAAYAEFWFTDVNWPDFTPEIFVDALVDYGKRCRRFGGI